MWHRRGREMNSAFLAFFQIQSHNSPLHVVLSIHVMPLSYLVWFLMTFVTSNRRITHRPLRKAKKGVVPHQSGALHQLHFPRDTQSSGVCDVSQLGSAVLKKSFLFLCKTIS